MKGARKDVATVAKGVCTPQASAKGMSTAVSLTEMAKRKHKGICTTKKKKKSGNTTMYIISTQKEN